MNDDSVSDALSVEVLGFIEGAIAGGCSFGKAIELAKSNYPLRMINLCIDKFLKEPEEPKSENCFIGKRDDE